MLGGTDMLGGVELFLTEARLKWDRLMEKKGPGGPLRSWLGGLLPVVVGIGWENHQTPVDREGFELNAEADALFVREGGADSRPFLLCLPVGLEFLHRKHVQVRLGGGFCGCWAFGGLCLIAIVHLNCS
jgi:hypothetical protein